MNRGERILCLLLRGSIRAYRVVLTPLRAVFGWHSSCRFSPSCSRYAEEAVERHGPWRGGWLAVRRILRCHPWGGFGPDPVPETAESPKKSKFREKSG